MAKPNDIRWSRIGRRAVLVTLVAVALWGVSDARAGADVRDLVRRADHVLRGKTTAALIQMRVHTQSYDRTYSMVYWADETAASDKTLVKVLGPARWRGHGTLKIGGRLSLYDPQSDRVTWLSGSMLGDSWMGSHFSNDDLVKETDLASHYTPKILRTWTGRVGGEDVIYHRISLSPTPKAPVSWHHIDLELYVRGADVIPTRQQYYRRAGQPEPTRTLSLSEVHDIGGRTAPTRLTMRVADKPGEYTQLDYAKVTFDKPIPADKFTESALKQ